MNMHNSKLPAVLWYTLNIGTVQGTSEVPASMMVEGPYVSLRKYQHVVSIWEVENTHSINDKGNSATGGLKSLLYMVESRALKAFSS